MTTSRRQGANRQNSRNNVAITHSATALGPPVAGPSHPPNDVLTRQSTPLNKACFVAPPVYRCQLAVDCSCKDAGSPTHTIG
jgi:hypothetical protein